MSKKKSISVFLVSVFFALVFIALTILITAQGLVPSEKVLGFENGAFYLFGQKYILIPAVSDFLSQYTELCSDIYKSLIPHEISAAAKKAADILSAALYDIIDGTNRIAGAVIHGNM